MKNTLQKLEVALPSGSLEAYISYVNRLPVLSLEEEQNLANRLQQQGDLEAAKQLVLSHLRVVVSIAKKYSGYGLATADLIQEGTLGLMKAVKRFDAGRGVRLVTFAVHWIKSEIHEFVLKNWRIVKVATTKPQRKLFFNLRGLKSRLGWLNQKEVNEIAKDLDVKPETLVQMEQRLAAVDSAFDGPMLEDEDSRVLAPVHYLEDHSQNPALLLENHNWQNQAKTSLQLAMESLDLRSQEILAARWLAEEKVTLQSLAEKYNVSAERIRQLEKMAIDKLRMKLPAYCSDNV